MPRKRGFCVNNDKFSKDLLMEIIEGKKRRLKVTNAELGELIGVTGQAFGHRLKDANFEYIHLIKIFQRLQFSQDEILRLMTQE